MTNNNLITDVYYLIYGVKYSPQLYRDIIDFVVDCGEYEGELMEFIGDDEWDFFSIEGRGKPERYDWLEGFPEEYFGLQSIYNTRGEDILFTGTIVWSSKNIEFNKIVEDPRIQIPALITEKAIEHKVKSIIESLKRKNDYWMDSVPEIGYYWINGTT